MRHPTYTGAFLETWTDTTAVEAVRFVALDSETTGLDPRRDRLISIGAVAVQGGEILLEDSFEVMMTIAFNNASVTVHGITRDEARGGSEESQALETFLDYLRDGVIVGHHIGHDIAMLNQACRRHFQMELQNRWVDTMDLTLRLNEDGAFRGRPMAKGFTLDALCDLFHVEAHDRHTAGGDAFLTAQVFLRLLALARRTGYGCLGQLCVPYTTP